MNFDCEQSKFDYWNQSNAVDLDSHNDYKGDVDLDFDNSCASQTQSNESESHSNSNVISTPLDCVNNESRPTRVRKSPSYLKDYVR